MRRKLFAEPQEEEATWACAVQLYVGMIVPLWSR